MEEQLVAKLAFKSSTVWIPVCFFSVEVLYATSKTMIVISQDGDHP
jgi:hypothetical protein